MSELLHVAQDGGTISVRAEEGSDGRIIEGIAVPYGQPTRRGATREYGNRREAFRTGAFARVIESRGERSLPGIYPHEGDVVAAFRIFDSPEGLRYEGRALRSQAAEAFLEAAREGLISPSIEFIPGRVAERGDLVEHVDVEALAGIGFTYRPAYAGTTAAVRHEEGDTIMTTEATELPEVAQRAAPVATAAQLPISQEALHALVTEATDEAMRRQIEGGAILTRGSVEATPWDGMSLADMVIAAGEPGASREFRGYAARALADVVTTAGANAGATTANTFGEVRRLVELGRPAITAFGGPAPLPGVGSTFGYPYYDGTLTDLVAAQAAQKDEIESAVVDIKRATATIATYAGGADISYQLIRRSDPGYIEMWSRIILAAWAIVTDTAFCTALEAGSVTGDFAEALASVDATELKNLMVDASVAVQLATGTPAEFVLAGTNAFKAAAKLMTPAPVFNAPGTANARTLEVNVAGLPVIHEPYMTSAKFLVSNRSAARWHEDGPFQASAEDVAKLGRDVAYWSLGAPAIYVPAAVIEVYDVTP